MPYPLDPGVGLKPGFAVKSAKLKPGFAVKSANKRGLRRVSGALGSARRAGGRPPYGL